LQRAVARHPVEQAKKTVQGALKNSSRPSSRRRAAEAAQKVVQAAPALSRRRAVEAARKNSAVGAIQDMAEKAVYCSVGIQ
jgi:hypothetical protein